MITILLVEDEASFREALAYQLTQEGFAVRVAVDGNAALDAFDDTVDLVLLDLMLPGVPGLDVCKELRRRSEVPIIMLTAKDSEIDKVVGLEVGADDYVTKPFSFRELLARMNAVRRRGRTLAAPVLEGDLQAAEIHMDVDRHEVRVRGEVTALALREFELLEFLLRNADKVLTRGQLIDRIWGTDYVGDTKTLDVHVKRLRAKVEVDPGNPQVIVTVRGLGYKLVSRPGG